MLLMRAAKTALAEAERGLAKAQNSKPLRTSRAVYCMAGSCKAWAWGQ
jgi:Tfp pilus assembly protein PilX